MGDVVNQLFFVGNKCINVIGYLVKGYFELFEVGYIVEVNVFVEVIFVKVLGGCFNVQYVLLVWVYLDKYWKGQRDSNKCYQCYVQQVYFMQKIEIGYWVY